MFEKGTIVIVGGGVAGLSAAIFASGKNYDVHLIEANEKPGKKILVTGGGRCNVSNVNLDASKYFNNALASNIINRFGVYDALDFMEYIGVSPIIRNGHVYPRSEEARTIRDALINRCEKNRVKIHNNTKVRNINVTLGGFEVVTDGYTYEADKVIITTGGKAFKETESNDSGIEISKSLGHSISKLYPALTGICFNDKLCKAFGVRNYCRISLVYNDKIIASDTGEIQFNNYGISGVPVMNISRYVGPYIEEGKAIELVIDFIPEQKALNLQNIDYSGYLPDKLACVLQECSMFELKNYKLNITGLNDFDSAYLMRGGVDINQIDHNDMQSTLINNLYFAGEVLNVDGISGGYNIHMAIATGAIAGLASADLSYQTVKPTMSQLERWKDAEIGQRRG